MRNKPVGLATMLTHILTARAAQRKVGSFRKAMRGFKPQDKLGHSGRFTPQPGLKLSDCSTCLGVPPHLQHPFPHTSPDSPAPLLHPKGSRPLTSPPCPGRCLGLSQWLWQHGGPGWLLHQNSMSCLLSEPERPSHRAPTKPGVPD